MPSHRYRPAPRLYRHIERTTYRRQQAQNGNAYLTATPDDLVMCQMYAKSHERWRGAHEGM